MINFHLKMQLLFWIKKMVSQHQKEPRSNLALQIKWIEIINLDHHKGKTKKKIALKDQASSKYQVK